jgi:NAD(P)H-dependent FMN reductase
MIVVLSGTNRPGSNTRRIAGLAERAVAAAGAEVTLLDLHGLPPTLAEPSAYASKPEAFARFQDAILRAQGILTVTPEYNGSFPGVLKLFIDMLSFPDSLVDRPAAFIGLSAGRWGALRAVEQLETIFQYRHAHLYGRRLHIPSINDALDSRGELVDPEIGGRLEALAEGFVDFCQRLG